MQAQIFWINALTNVSILHLSSVLMRVAGPNEKNEKMY